MAITIDGLKFDEIGYWSELKLQILKDYAHTYSIILAGQTEPHLHHVYIDGFSGAGVHISKTTKDWVLGSPLNALLVTPPFKQYFMIDLDGAKVEHLRQAVGDRSDVEIFQGDCNKVLIEDVFPKVLFRDFRRGLCVLDPYGLHLNWEVLETAGKMRSLDIFLNFPVMDMNRNVLWREPEKAKPEEIARMNAFWGDETWRDVAYDTFNLFEMENKNPTKNVVDAFQKRLKEVAGFEYVPDPIPMRTPNKAIVYWLFFAAQKNTANKVVEHIFNTYRNREAA